MQSERKELTGRIEDLARRVESARYLLPEEQRRDWLKGLDALRQRLAETGEPLLHVGLLGGTGVGKSTLINALAGETISSVSDRRPHTDRIIVYRHADALPPADSPPFLLGEPQRTHRNEQIRHLTVYDFPDFDSLVTEHRQRVLGFLDRLDLIVWISSPEKYGDLPFYETLKSCDKHQENMVFVMNKIDKITSPDAAPQEVSRLIGDFSLKLKDAGIRAPRIYQFSARQGTNPQAAPCLRDDFLRFRESLFRQRKHKEILAIKAANIAVELDSLHNRVQGLCARLGLLRAPLEPVLASVRGRLQALSGKALQPVLDRFFTDRTLALLHRSWLARQEAVAPVGLLCRLWKGPENPGPGKDERPGWESAPDPDDERLGSLKQELSIPVDRLATLLYRFELTEAAEAFKDVGREWELEVESIRRAGSERFSLLAEALSSSGSPGIGGRLRRMVQRLWLSLPLFLLLVALAGPERIEAFAEQPGVADALRMGLQIVLSLFRPDGLVALIAFILIEILLSLWLAHREVREAGRTIDKLRGKFTRQLAQEAESKLQARLRQIEAMAGDLLQEVEAFSRDGRGEEAA
ncbi:MAG: GTPase domain-containing protein [bacterium]